MAACKSFMSEINTTTYLLAWFFVAFMFLACIGQLVFDGLLCPLLQYFNTDTLSDNNL